MVLLTKIYTKSGDKGKTSLGSGQRVLKNSLRMQAIGSVDELNASLGLIPLKNKELTNIIRCLQNDLFDIGGDLCFPEDQKPHTGALKIKGSYITRLEEQIDTYNSKLSPLTSFVLPGGSAESAYLHLSRTFARRSERAICALMQEEDINPYIFQYLNRLSDLLFVLARYQNNKGENDILWQPGGEN